MLEADLDQVQKSLQVCRRIFGGMLSFARGDVRRSRTGHVRTAIDTTLAILRTGIERRGIAARHRHPADDDLAAGRPARSPTSSRCCSTC